MKRHLPLLVALLLAPWMEWLDLKIAHFFYLPSSLSHRPFWDDPLLKGNYRWGTLPTYLLALLALLFLIRSLFSTRLQKWRQPLMALLLSLLISVSVIPNLLKIMWARPRPVQVVDFGGFASYCPFYMPLQLATPEACCSFPSGHVAAGFAFLGLCFLGKRLASRPLFWSGVATTLLFGGGLLFTRLAQGGHWLSDAIGSILIVWYTTYFCYKWIAPDDRTDYSTIGDLRIH
jgi:membrane-associated PAP2 superfamily phosphatase